MWYTVCVYLWEAAVYDVEEADGVVLQGREGLEDERALLSEQSQRRNCLTEEQLCH